MKDYKTFSDAVQRIGTEAGAAELHGQMVGLVCARQTLTLQQWLDESLPELVAAQQSGDALAKETAAILDDYFKLALSSLQDGQLGFQLLLLPDDDPLEKRIGELTEWCQGFLLGLALAGIKDFQHLPGELPDLLNDLVEISRAESYELDNEEEDETAYMELGEYVRLGVMMVWEEIHQLYESRTEQPSIH